MRNNEEMYCACVQGPCPVHDRPPAETDIERKVAIAKQNGSRWTQVETEALDMLVKCCRDFAEKLRNAS